MNKQLIQDLIESELKSVDAKWPNYHSHHEAFSVIMEEVQELQEEIEKIHVPMKSYWESIRHKSDNDIIKSESLKHVREKSYQAVIEAVQVYVTALRAERLCKK